jgi:preprotein translocase subunit SecA
MEEILEAQILLYCDSNNPLAWNVEPFNEWLATLDKNLSINPQEFKKSSQVQHELLDYLFEKVKSVYESKKAHIPSHIWTQLERNIVLDILDHRWKEHLYAMDHLREGIWTEGYSEKNPLIEYKLQGFKLFDAMVDNLKLEVISFLMRVEVTEPGKVVEQEKEYKKVGEENTNIDIFSTSLNSQTTNKRKVVSVSTSAGGSSARKSNRRRKR